ncbi:hypothetical protein F5B20DRAFT_545037 [Whalleya microplaca]|nr:hypothetical protein F5B20DRAFT_545037 [Whalleya microplaca]
MGDNIDSPFNFDDWIEFPPTPRTEIIEEHNGTVSVGPLNGTEFPNTVVKDHHDGSSRYATDARIGELQPDRLRLDVTPPGHAFMSAPRLRPLLPSEDISRAVDFSSGHEIKFINTSQAHEGTVPRSIGKRGRLNQTQLSSYRQTRQKGGSCIQCAFLKRHCGPETHCEYCRKKGIPAELCCRYKIRDLQTYSSQGLARMFIEKYHGSISAWKHQKHKVNLWHGFGSPLALEVCQYQPNKDIIDIFWKNPTGWQNLAHTGYGLTSIEYISSATLDQYAFSKIPYVLKQLTSSGRAESLLFVRTLEESLTFQATCPFKDLAALVNSCLQLWIFVFLQYHGILSIHTQGTSGSDLEEMSLGMAKLASDAHQGMVLGTPFAGTVPLPRLLDQQIHACIEGRMEALDKKVLAVIEGQFKALNSAAKLNDTEYAKIATGLYLAIFVYLSVLEEVAWDAARWESLLSKFNWPLDQSPQTRSEYSHHAAKTITAHLQAAFKNRSLWQILRTPHGHMKKKQKLQMPNEGPFISIDSIIEELQPKGRSNFILEPTSI